MKTVFVSFVGNRDPYNAPNPTSKTEDYGPAINLILQLVREQKLIFDEILFFYSVEANKKFKIDYQESYLALNDVLQTLVDNAQIKGIPLSSEAVDGRGLLKEISVHLEPLRHSNVVLHINTNSGTQQMTEALKILAATEWFRPAEIHLWQTIEKEFRQENKAAYRKYALPYITEALLLKEAFVAFRRYHFAQAQSLFQTLELQELEIVGRQERIGYLAGISESLHLLTQKKHQEAYAVLRRIQIRVQLPALEDLLGFLEDLQNQEDVREPNDASVWEGWAKINRYHDAQDALNGVIWAQILNEMVVWYLCQKRNLPDTINQSHPVLGNRLQSIADEYPTQKQWRNLDPQRGITINQDHVLRVQLLRSKAAGLYPEQVGNVFDNKTNPTYEVVVKIRNKIVHDNHAVQTEHLEKAMEFAQQVIQVYPFNVKKHQGKYKNWVSQPDLCPTSAQSIQSLAQHLQEWLG